MKKLTKRIIQFMFALTLVVATATISTEVKAATSKGFTYEVKEDKTVKITGYTGKSTSLVIPKKIANKKVTEIGSNAFNGHTGIKKATIGKNVTYIGGWAFSSCPKLKEFKVASGNKTYKAVNGVLYSKDKKRLIVYPSGKTAKNVKFVKGVTDIEYGAFGGNTFIQTVTFPNSVTYMSSDLFWGCSKLKKVVIPKKVERIGGYTLFFACDKLTEIKVDKNNQFYASKDGVLYNKKFTELVSYPSGKKGKYTLPKTVKTIGPYAVYRLRVDVEIVLPSKLKKLSHCAFWGNDTMTTITVPASVKTIEEDALGGCDNLVISVTKDSYAHKYVEKNNLNFKVID